MSTYMLHISEDAIRLYLVSLLVYTHKKSISGAVVPAIPSLRVD